MREGELLYFTPAEYIVMMEIAGGGTYSMLHGSGLEPTDAALVQAFTTLFQRGMLLRAGDGFTLGQKGRIFACMKRARFAVLLSAASAGLAAVCYVGRDGLWLVELADDILSRRYRLRRMERGSVRKWLEDAECLEPPTLWDADAAELGRLFEDTFSDSVGTVLFRLERHLNGGLLLCTYELTEGRGGRMLVRRDSQGRTAEIYTEEALSRTLAECFGEDVT